MSFEAMEDDEGFELIEQCYKTLKLTPQASFNEVSRNFKKMALECHSDKNEGIADEEFKKLNEAYKILQEYNNFCIKNSLLWDFANFKFYQEYLTIDKEIDQFEKEIEALLLEKVAFQTKAAELKQALAALEKSKNHIINNADQETKNSYWKEVDEKELEQKRIPDKLKEINSNIKENEQALKVAVNEKLAKHANLIDIQSKQYCKYQEKQLEKLKSQLLENFTDYATKCCNSRKSKNQAIYQDFLRSNDESIKYQQKELSSAKVKIVIGTIFYIFGGFILRSKSKKQKDIARQAIDSLKREKGEIEENYKKKKMEFDKPDFNQEWEKKAKNACQSSVKDMRIFLEGNGDFARDISIKMDAIDKSMEKIKKVSLEIQSKNIEAYQSGQEGKLFNLADAAPQIAKVLTVEKLLNNDEADQTLNQQEPAGKNDSHSILSMD